MPHRSRLAAFAAVASLFIATGTAQAHGPTDAPRYVAIDVGTLGGPNALPNEPGHLVTDNGIVVGSAETPALNPFPQECNACHATDAFQWRDGAMTDLGNLGGYNAGLFELNRSGIGVGFSETGAIDPASHLPQVHAVTSDHGRLTDLGTLGGGNSWASAIDDRGDVSGFAQNTVPDPYDAFLAPAYPANGATQWHATLWRHGRIEDLGTLGGPDSVGGLINEHGEVAGSSFTGAHVNDTTGMPTFDPFVWRNGRMHDLGSLGGTLGFAAWLNDAGELAGTSNLAGDHTSHPFLWNGRRMIDLGTLGGDNGSASWVSNSGAVAGSADIPGGEHHGFLWKNGVMSDLPPIAGAPCANAEFAGENGDAVGNATDCHGTELNAVLWRHGHAYNLNDLIAPTSLHLTTAAYANRRGEIFTIALLPNGDQHIVLLVPGARAAAEGLHTTAARVRGSSLRATGCAFGDTRPRPAASDGNRWDSRCRCHGGSRHCMTK
jgi:probable HAF family extracellular repeat protein